MCTNSHLLVVMCPNGFVDPKKQCFLFIYYYYYFIILLLLNNIFLISQNSRYLISKVNFLVCF